MVMNKAICNRYYETTCSAILRNILHLPYVLGIFLVSLLAAARHEVLRARIAGKGKIVKQIQELQILETELINNLAEKTGFTVEEIASEFKHLHNAIKNILISKDATNT